MSLQKWANALQSSVTKMLPAMLERSKYHLMRLFLVLINEFNVRYVVYANRPL